MILIELHVYGISIFIVTWSRHSIIALGILWPKLGEFWPFYMSNCPYSRLRTDPEFRVKYVDPGFRVNLTRFASVAYWPGSGSRLDPIWVKFDPDVFRVYALTNHEVICISVLQGEVGYTVGITHKIKVKWPMTCIFSSMLSILTIYRQAI